MTLRASKHQVLPLWAVRRSRWEYRKAGWQKGRSGELFAGALTKRQLSRAFQIRPSPFGLVPAHHFPVSLSQRPRQTNDDQAGPTSSNHLASLSTRHKSPRLGWMDRRSWSGMVEWGSVRAGFHFKTGLVTRTRHFNRGHIGLLIVVQTGSATDPDLKSANFW